MAFDLRFYDVNREEFLYMFAEFMVILAVILLLPFLLMRKPPQE
jgi:flagellar biogenesis protein FliO